LDVVTFHIENFELRISNSLVFTIRNPNFAIRVKRMARQPRLLFLRKQPL